MDYKYYLQKIHSKIKSSTSSYINIKCPICNEGSSPYKSRGYILLNGDHVTYFCHNCMTEGISFYTFLTQVDSTVASEYLTESKKEKLYAVKEQKKLASDIKELFKEQEPLFTVREFTEAVYILQDEEIHYPLLPLNEDALEYMLSRGFSYQDLEDLRFVKETYDIVFPLWYNKGKNLVYGMQMRSITQKRFHNSLFKDNPKVWNLMYCLSLPKGSTIFISESIIDAMSTGFKNIIASLGKTISSELLEMLKDYELIFLFDADVSGDKSALKYSKAGYKCLVHVKDMYHFKDFNKLLELGKTKEEIREYILENISTPLKTQISLKLRGV